MRRNRAFFARSFCAGRGIEIGALHHPTEMPPEAQVRYVDRLSNEELRRHYPELEGQPLVDLDVIDDGETLGLLPDCSEDFVLACQFIEHCQNPIRALVNMLRVVRDRKFVLITVPDKRQTFDIDRPITSNEHLLDECLHGAERNHREHYREWAALVEKIPAEEVEARVDKLMKNAYSIHYHVWDFDAFIKFLLFIKDKFKLPFEIFSVWQNGMELMVALRKVIPGPAGARPEFPNVAKY
jgi:hypothetical protein